MVTHRGYSAWIELNGEPLEEYAIETKDRVTSCYVCSEEGAEFTLRFDDDGTHRSRSGARYGRSIVIKMDGVEVETLWGDFEEEVSTGGVEVGDTAWNYVFASVDTTDDDNIAIDANSESIGVIQAEVTKGTRPRRSRQKGAGGPKAPGILSNAPVHERSKKAGSHRVVLGGGTNGHGSRTTFVAPKNVGNSSWAIFRFLYRKRDVLKANKILPQSPIPFPSPKNSPSPSTRIGGMKDKGKGIKRERDEDHNDGPIEVSDDEDLDVSSDDEDLEVLMDKLRQFSDRVARKKAKWEKRAKRARRAKEFIKRESSSSADVIDLT